MTSFEEPIKVLKLVSSFPPVYSGCVIQAIRLAEALRLKGVKVSFLAPTDSDHYYTDNFKGFTIYRFPIWKNSRASRIRSILTVLYIFMKHKQSFDILHVHGPHFLSILYAGLAKLFAKKVIFKNTLLGWDSIDGIEQEDWGILNPLYSKIYRSVDKIVCIVSGQYDRNLNGGIAKNKLCLIPNGIDVEIYSKNHALKEEYRKKLGLNLKETYGLSIGAVRKRKGGDILIQVSRTLRDRSIPVKFLILGPTNPGDISNPFYDDMMKQISKYQLDQNMKFIGQVDNVHEWLKAADFFILPTQMEGFCSSIIEAMAAGLPVIVNKIDGVTTDIVQDGNGVLIENNRVSDYIQAIIELLYNPEKARALSIKAKKDVFTNYNINNIAERYLEVYKQLLDVSKGN